MANMAHFISNNHIVFNHMDASHSYMLGYSYFASPDYLVAKAWIRAIILLPSFTYLTCTNTCVYMKIFWVPGIPYHCSVAWVDVVHPFIMTGYPSL